MDPEAESFSCPGVPDSSVQAVTGEVTFIPMVYWEKDDALRYLTCSGTVESTPSVLFKAEFGRQSPGNPALRVWGCCRWGLSAGLGGCCQVVFEASGVDEAADGVVGEVAESQGDAA